MRSRELMEDINISTEYLSGCCAALIATRPAPRKAQCKEWNQIHANNTEISILSMLMIQSVCFQIPDFIPIFWTSQGLNRNYKLVYSKYDRFFLLA